MKPAHFFIIVAFLASGVTSSVAAEPTPEEIEFFEKKVRPVLVEHCYRCHSSEAKKPKGGLLLDSRAGLLKGGDSGPALVPGQPSKSRFIEAIGYKNVDLQMPPRAKLPDHIIADLTAWVKMAAPWPKESATKGLVDKYAFDLAKRKQQHWAWKPIQPGKPPVTKNQSWPVTPVDRFLLAKLEEKGLNPAPATDPRTLLRRVTFDLIGLPPTPEEVEAFVKECRERDTVHQQALEKVVDRLLASPHFGERWGRHWLDLVRYAESRGHEFDYTLPNAHQYRDYVIRALNLDVPYDQFVIEHLAGDLLERPRLHPGEGFNESILGTGFWFLGEQVHSPVDICQDKADRQDNMIDVMTKTFLGLTVACARCHDHKFDAISTKDYYALAGFLESSGYRLARFDSLEHNARIAQDLAKFRQDNQPVIQKAVAESWKPGLEKMADYLLASHEAIQTNRTAKEIAEQKKLDEKVLAQWIKHLNQAAKNPNDPLHYFVLGKEGKAEIKSFVVDRWKKRQMGVDGFWTGTVVISYAKVSAEDWIQDGHVFGSGPRKAGEIVLGNDPSQPILRVQEKEAAERDPWLDRLKIPPGAENEPGALGKMVRAGRTLRTPTFRVGPGKVFYLVRGTGMAYASVDGHVMIAGPLHGQLVQGIKTGPDFQWISQDLTRYQGNRAHLEFTPAEGSDFAIAMVVQTDNPPVFLNAVHNNALWEIHIGDKSPAELAQDYQKLFLDIGQRLASNQIQDWAEDYARLANWVLQHKELFPGTEESNLTLAKKLGPILLEQNKLLNQVKLTSRLAPAMLDGNGVDEHVFIRGTYKTPGEVVPRRFLEALVGTQPLKVVEGSGRLDLARQMTDPATTPLVPRVLVNRLWHHLFGRGIVSSVDNFGALGEPPTHPELLDFLADQFVKEGWSIKKMIRSLVLSRAYQMSSQPDERAVQNDPQNLLLHHARVRRLEGEAIRDAILQVSARLDRKMFGPSVPVYLTAFQEGRGRPASGPLDGNGRRSIYLGVRRNFLPAMLLAFDTPIPFSTVGRRTVSNVPAQALILLNDPFVHQQAGLWAKQVLAQGGSSKDRVTRMYLTAFGRLPSEKETSACLDFLDRQSRLQNGTPNEMALWTDLAHVLFNAKEFIFLN